MDQSGHQYPYPQQYQYPYQTPAQQPAQHQQTQPTYAQPQHGHQQQMPYNYGYPNQQYSHQPSPSYPSPYPQYHNQHYPAQYPQQYTQQQYQQQSNSPYGTGSLQNASGQHQYHRPPLQNPPQASPDAETCFNCGLPNHYAQNCPEPRREVPAGQLKRQKRFQNRNFSYTNNGLPQTYSPTSNLQHPYTNPQQLGLPQSASPINQQTPQPYTAHQWQPPASQGGYQQPAHQAYQHTQQTPQPGHPTAPLTSFHGQVNDPPMETDRQIPTPANPGPDMHGLPAPPSTLPPPPQGPPLTDAQSDDTKEVSMDDQASDDENDEDDFLTLDIPDLSHLASLYGPAVVKPVRQALPSNFIVADALYPLPQPGPEDDGKCFSKYFENVSEEASLLPAQESIYWKDRQDDTMFSGFEEDGNIIPIQDCLSIVDERRQPLAEETKAIRDHLQPIKSRSLDAAHMKQTLEDLEIALAAAKAQQAEMIANRKKQPRQRSESEQAPSIHEASPAEDHPKSPARTEKKEKQSPTPLKTWERRPSIPRKQSQGSPPLSASPTNSRNSSREFPRGQGWQPKGSGYHPPKHPYFRNGVPPPPPPPPPSTAAEASDRNNSNMSPPGETRQHRYGPAMNRDGASPETSPRQSRPEANFQRKRSYEQYARSSSSSEGDSPRRQEDDSSMRNKKRQPKVADAYSRRW